MLVDSFSKLNNPNLNPNPNLSVNPPCSVSYVPLSVIFRWIIEAMKQRLASRALGVSSVFEETNTSPSLMLPPKVYFVCVTK